MEVQITILQYLESIRNDMLTAFFTTITMMAEEIYVTLFLAVLYWFVDKYKARKLAYFVLFNSVLNSMIKNIINMPRPYQVGAVSPIRVQTATGSSFPSGHTQTATSFWVGMMLVLKTKACVILGAIMIVLTALSRLYLGVHWPMDVLGAIVFGIIFTYFAQETMKKDQITSWHVLITSVLVLAVLLIPVDANVYKSGASIWGLCLGGYLEERYVKYDPKNPQIKKWVKVVVGLAGLILIYVGINYLLPDIKVIDMLKYALCIAWVIVGAPWCFIRLSHLK